MAAPIQEKKHRRLKFESIKFEGMCTSSQAKVMMAISGQISRMIRPGFEMSPGLAAEQPTSLINPPERTRFLPRF
jgi:hypothetical protein